MPTYALIFKPQARRELDKIRGQDYQHLLAAIDNLREEPRPGGIQKVSGSNQPPLWRIRVRNFRIVYIIDDDDAKITIDGVARRNERTYRRLG